MLKRHEIQVLRRAGHAQIDVAKLAGVSLGSVRRVEREPEVTHIASWRVDLTRRTAFTRPAVGKCDPCVARRPGPGRRRRPAPRGRSEAERLDAAEPDAPL